MPPTLRRRRGTASTDRRPARVQRGCPGLAATLLFIDPLHFHPILGDAIVAEGLAQRR
jgi:hypothetical protein